MQELYNYIEEEDIELIEDDIPGRVKGLYFDNIIVLHKGIKTNAERHCILAEELGHYFTSSGINLDQSSIETIKQENSAHRWATNELIDPFRLIDAFKAGVRNRWELAQFLNVTELFIENSLLHLKKLYGDTFAIDEYVVYFDPLWVYKSFD